MTTYQEHQALTAVTLNGASGSTVRLYEYLKNAQSLAAAHGRAWITPRAASLADDLGRSVRTIRRALADLKRRNLTVSQARFVMHASGAMRQISNRLRVVTTVAASALLAAKRLARAAALRKYRGDIPVTPRTERFKEAASRDLFLDRDAWEKRHASPSKGPG